MSPTRMPTLRLVLTLDFAPSPAAWKDIQKSVSRANGLRAKGNPNQIIDGSFARTLGAIGYLSQTTSEIGQ